MRMITLTKKKVKRLTAIGLLAAATAAAGVGAILTSVGTQATERQLPVYCVERSLQALRLRLTLFMRFSLMVQPRMWLPCS